jgi:translocator protein
VRSVTGLVLWGALVFLAAYIGSQWTSPQWYAELRTPPWSPPAWVFGPVWTALYSMMAVAAWLVWRANGFGGTRLALSVFLVQLGLNAAWSGLFFGLQRPGLAFAEIVVLWWAILATLVLFWKHNRVAGWLLVPYLAWVTFAAALNYSIWRLN